MKAYKRKGLAWLAGTGIEIGALHRPTPVPKGCRVSYCDVAPRETSIKHFPELDVRDLVSVDHLCDLDTDGLSIFEDGAHDFVILNHVIEHVANPIRVIQELFRVTRPGGVVLLSVPDKRFTFDKHRALTDFDHLHTEYQANVTEVTDDHYLDFLQGVHPEMLEGATEQRIKALIANVRRRKEHAHVWTSDTFRQFLSRSFELLAIHPECLFEDAGDNNQIEYFSVWRQVAAGQPVA